MPEEITLQRRLVPSWAGSAHANSPFPLPKTPCQWASSLPPTSSSLLATALQLSIAPTLVHPLGSVFSQNSLCPMVSWPCNCQPPGITGTCRQPDLCEAPRVPKWKSLRSDTYTHLSHSNWPVMGLPLRSCHQLWGHQMREPLTYLGPEKPRWRSCKRKVSPEPGQPRAC